MYNFTRISINPYTKRITQYCDIDQRLKWKIHHAK